MRNWIRKLFGIDTIDKNINDINISTQDNIEDINKLLIINTETNSKLENISKLLEGNDNKINSKIIEPISNIKLSNNSDIIEFNLENNFQLDDSWVLLNSSNQTENFLSQALGVSTIAASSIYSTSGLYTATTSVGNLIRYANGTISSITMNGSKFGQHAGFVSANATVFTPVLAFQFASMLTGQYYFNGLNKQLISIHESINNLILLHHNERLAKLRYINFKITELNKRSYFTIEDYLIIDQLKYDLSIIRFEYLLTAKQEINKVLDIINVDDKNNITEIINEDVNVLEQVKLSIKEKTTKLSTVINDKFNTIFQDSVLDKGVNSIRNLTENSKDKAIKLTAEILNSKYFFYSDISLNAEHLYQLSKLLELKMNISDKEPDLNRIGKIKEIYTSISSFNIEDSVFDEIESLNVQLKSKLVNDFNILKENSIVNKNEINSNGNKILNEINKSQHLISRRNLLFKDIEKIKIGFEKNNKILINNRNNKTEVYIQNGSD